MAPGRPPEMGAAARLGAVAAACLTAALLALVPSRAPARATARLPAAADGLVVLDDAAAAGQSPGGLAASSLPADGADAAPAADEASWAAGAAEPMEAEPTPEAAVADGAVAAAGEAAGTDGDAGANAAQAAWEAGTPAAAAPSPADAAAAGASQPSVAPATMVGLHFDPSAITTPAAVRSGEFITDAMGRKSFPWASPTRSVRDAMQAAFPNGAGWTPTRFAEGDNTTWTLELLAQWVEKDLFGGPDPFASHSGQVPVPWNTELETGDQLGPKQWVGYSRRQVCFIVAKSLVGAGTVGYSNGLLRFMEKRTGSGGMARSGGFGRSWWGLLAACAADHSLKGGGQGPQLVVAKADAPGDVADLRSLAKEVPASTAELRVCRYGDGSGGALPAGLRPVPAEGCAQPSGDWVGKDFMAGGLAGQALQDISAAWLGGYVFGNADGLGGGQDERLMVFYPEVSALTFFLSQSPRHDPEAPQLRQPVWILGARRLFAGIDGTCRHDSPPKLDAAAPLSGDLVAVDLGGKRYRVSGSRPFLAFMSENQGFITDPPGPAQDAALKLARRNKEPRQRDVSPESKWSFEKQVRAWYRAVALTSYSESVQPALRTLAISVGAGPWLAGLWFGDSQLGFLASWMGQALAAQTWGQSLPLDYYIYSSFTENPGNQCFVHAEASCHACLKQCSQAPLPKQSYWLPSNAQMAPNGDNPCVVDQGDCGRRGLEDVVKAYESRKVSELWTDLEAAMWQHQGVATSTIFDLLLQSAPAPAP